MYSLVSILQYCEKEICHTHPVPPHQWLSDHSGSGSDFDCVGFSPTSEQTASPDPIPQQSRSRHPHCWRLKGKKHMTRIYLCYTASCKFDLIPTFLRFSVLFALTALWFFQFRYPSISLVSALGRAEEAAHGWFLSLRGRSFSSELVHNQIQRRSFLTALGRLCIKEYYDYK